MASGGTASYSRLYHSVALLLPDATVLVLQGLIFVVLLTSETLYGRFAIFRAGDAKERT